MMNFIFGWINLGILVALGHYLYKKYVKHPINKMVNYEEQSLASLKSEASSLETHVKEVTIDLILQKNRTAQILNKVKNWQKAFEQNFNDTEESVKNIQQKIDSNNKIKSQNLAFQISKAKLLSEISNTTKKSVIKKFSDHKYAQNYLDNTVKNLEQN